MNTKANEEGLKKLKESFCFKDHECVECKVPAVRQCIPDENDFNFEYASEIIVIQRCPKCKDFKKYRASKMEDHSFVSNGINTSSKIQLVK